ncbi:hypothetical protein [Methylobacterium sp. D54C]
MAALDSHNSAELCGVKAHVNVNEPYGVVVVYRDNDYSKAGMDWLDQEAGRNGWYRTRSGTQGKDKFACFEPEQIPPVPTPKELYHATDVGNADRILDDGFALTATGRTWMDRTYLTPRVFFATSLNDAVIFIRSMKGKTSATAAAELTLADLQAWEILKVEPGDRTYYQDVEFPSAVWTEEDVPAREVSRLVGWRDGLIP